MLGRCLAPLALLIILILPACSPHSEGGLSQVCFGKQCFDVEVAQTQEERYKGLQFRKALGKNNGMLFIFSKSKRHTFWMKDTLIPLDIIWIDHKKRAVSIMRNILPCKTAQCPAYTPKENALYVLEVNSGVTIEQGIKVGDRAVFK